MKSNMNNLPSTTITTDDGRQDHNGPEPQRRISPRSRKPTSNAKLSKEQEGEKIDSSLAAVSEDVEETLLNSKLPEKEEDICLDVLEARTNTYLYEKKGKVQKMYQRYQNQWKEFVRKNNVEKDLDDQALVRFFKEKRSRYAPSTLWVVYACVNAYVIDKYGISLKTMPRLARYLKAQTHLYVTTKSKTFTPETSTLCS